MVATHRTRAPLQQHQHTPHRAPHVRPRRAPHHASGPIDGVPSACCSGRRERCMPALLILKKNIFRTRSVILHHPDTVIRRPVRVWALASGRATYTARPYRRDAESSLTAHGTSSDIHACAQKAWRPPQHNARREHAQLEADRCEQERAQLGSRQCCSSHRTGGAWRRRDAPARADRGRR